MNGSKNLEFSTFDSLDTNELEFLKKNSIKLDDALKSQLNTDPDYLFKIEKEIGSYFYRNPSILEAEMVYDYYIRIISFSGLEPKDVHQLKLLSKFPAPLKSYVNDKNVDLNINQIFFTHGENKLGERLGESKAIHNLKIWHDGRLNKAQIQDIQTKLQIPTSGIIDKDTLVKIIEFQTYNCKLVDGKVILNGETYSKIQKIQPKTNDFELVKVKVHTLTTTKITSPTEMPQSDNIVDSLEDLDSQDENIQSTELKTGTVQVLDSIEIQSSVNEAKIKVPKNNIDKIYNDLLKDYGTIERPSGIEFIGEVNTLKLLNKKAQKDYGQKMIISMQVCFGLPITNKYDEYLIESVINYQISKGIEPVSLIPEIDSDFFNYLHLEDSFPKNPARLSTMYNYKILDSQLGRFSEKGIDNGDLQSTVIKNKGYDNLIKRNQHNLSVNNKNGVKELQVLLGIPANGLVDKEMIDQIYVAQLEMKAVKRKGLLDLKVSPNGELMGYLKYKHGTILKKLLIDNFSDDAKIDKMKDRINTRLETQDFKSEHVLNFLENIPSNIISEMILSYGMSIKEDFTIFQGKDYKSYHPYVDKIQEDHIVLFLSEVSSFGLKDKLIKGKGKQYNKVTKITRCSRTARQNLVETFGIAYEDVIKGDAQVAKNSLESQNLMINTFGYDDAESTINNMVKEMKGNVFDIYFDKNYDANGNIRPIKGREKYGHRCVVFIGTDGNLWCLDPYVVNSKGVKTNKPYLFKDHLFVNRFAIGVSQKSYYSDKLSFYDFDNTKSA